MTITPTLSGPAAAKIAVAGAGQVGVTLGYACLIRGTGKTIALYGRNAKKVRAEVTDLQHGLPFVPVATVEGSDDVEVCRGADIVVLAVGGRPRPGETRLDLAADSVAICQDVLPRCSKWRRTRRYWSSPTRLTWSPMRR